MEILTDITALHIDFGDSEKLNGFTLYVKYGEASYKTRLLPETLITDIVPGTHLAVWEVGDEDEFNTKIHDPRYLSDRFLGYVVGIKLNHRANPPQSGLSQTLNNYLGTGVQETSGKTALRLNPEAAGLLAPGSELVLENGEIKLTGILNTTNPVEKGITKDMDIARFLPNGTLPITPFINDEIPSLRKFEQISNTVRTVNTLIKELNNAKNLS